MSAHNKAKLGEIAKSVLLPGDPDRATFIASNFLTDVKLISELRGQKVYTGYYNHKEISVASSGMGSASAGIYIYELFTEYEVDNIIRIGTSGGLKKEQTLGELVFALSASTDSNFAHQYNLKGTFSPCCKFELLEKAVGVAKALEYNYSLGMVFSSDLFSSYNALGGDSWKPWAACGAIAQDMETYALYSIASVLGKNALSILNMTDNLVTNKSFKDEERMIQNSKMIRTGLECLTI